MSSNPITSYTDSFNQQLRPLLDKYDLIRHHLEKDPDLHATSIVVIGDQSSGKSSVLESLVQIGLPRGENIVTRMPIILQCRCLKPNSNETEHAQVSIGSPNDRRCVLVDNFDNLESTIQECQTTVMEENDSLSNDEINQISDTPIYVQIVKAGIPDVTLTDLPGMNYNNPTIKGQIEEMYKRYIAQPSVIILNVISAVTDINANESVLFAKMADPKEERTIYVLTKVDKCSRNDVLAKVRQLKSSKPRYVFVRNRNPEEIAANVAWNEIRQKEYSYLASFDEVDPIYKGVPALSSILVTEGHKMIVNSVYQLLDKTPELLKDLRMEVEFTGEICSTDIEKKTYFDKIAHKMAPRVQQLLNGSSNADDPEHLLMNSKIQDFLKALEKRLSEGAGMIFTEDFRNQVERSLDDTEGLTLPNFLSNRVFNTMLDRLMKNSGVHKFITREVLLGEDGENPESGIIPYLNNVMDTLIGEALQGLTVGDRFGRFFRKNVKEFIEKTGKEVADSLTQLVNAELEAGPYTCDRQYLGCFRNVETQVHKLKRKFKRENSDEDEESGPSEPRRSRSSSASVDESDGSIYIGQGVIVRHSEISNVFTDSNNQKGLTVFLMQSSLFSYWTIVRKRLRDHVHLLVMYALCGKLRRWEELMDSLWKENSADYIELLVEDINVTQKRNRLQKRIQKLEETSRVLSSITATLNEYRGNNAATIES